MQAADGMAATQTAVREQPDLILLDVGMPAGDGYTVANRLKMNTRTSGIPIIYLTARSSEADLRRASEAGAAAYVIKPFDSKHLLEVIGEVLAKQ